MSTKIELDSLILAAMQRVRAGRLEEAVEYWTKVRAIAPDQPQALFYLGRHHLYQRNTQTALELLTRAAEVTPKEPAIHLNLAYAYQAAGNADAELRAIVTALTLDPYFLPALLNKGAAFERSGKRRLAAQAYKEALKVVSPTQKLPDELASQIDHAREIVGKDAEELSDYLNSSLAPMHARYPGSKTDRFEECRDILIGTKKIYSCEPTMLHFPRLPAIQFYERETFPWLTSIEAETDAIRDELIPLIRTDRKEFRPYVNHQDGVPLNQWAELNRSPRWSSLFLWENSKRIDEHCARCPRTAAALAAIPLCDMGEFGPTAFFSALEPHTRIPPHTGVTNVRLTVHLPLILPEKCAFRVGNETREWRIGKTLIFDDTIEHEAWNNSDELRVILIFDIWNPFLDMAEREQVGELLRSVRTYYADN